MGHSEDTEWDGYLWENELIRTPDGISESDEVFTDDPPPEEVTVLEDSEGDIWHRSGDRWFLVFSPGRHLFWDKIPEELRRYLEWDDMQAWTPYREAR